MLMTSIKKLCDVYRATIWKNPYDNLAAHAKRRGGMGQNISWNWTFTISMHIAHSIYLKKNGTKFYTSTHSQHFIQIYPHFNAYFYTLGSFLHYRKVSSYYAYPDRRPSPKSSHDVVRVESNLSMGGRLMQEWGGNLVGRGKGAKWCNSWAMDGILKTYPPTEMGMSEWAVMRYNGRTFEGLSPDQNCDVRVGCNALQWKDFSGNTTLDQNFDERVGCNGENFDKLSPWHNLRCKSGLQLEHFSGFTNLTKTAM